MFYTVKFKSLLKFILITLCIGLVSGLLSIGSMDTYQTLIKPTLSPPPIVFPIVWTILYILMGISAYLIYNSNADKSTKSAALNLYWLQLGVNFFWPIIFFNLNAYLLAFLWLIILWILIVSMIIQFYKIDKVAAYLQIPYLLWVTFAGYLNLSIYLLNS